MDSGCCAPPPYGRILLVQKTPAHPTTQFKIKAMSLGILGKPRHFKSPDLTSIKCYWSRILHKTHLPFKLF